MARAGVVVTFAVLLVCFTISDSARILGIFTSHSKSHLIVHMSIIRPMIERGHDVTIVTSLDLKEPNLKFRHIKIDLPPMNMGGINTTSQGIIKNLQLMANVPFRVMEQNNAVLKTPEFKKLMKEDSFDLVVLGYFFNDFHIGIAGHFKCPLIINWMGTPIRTLANMVGNPAEVFYVPDMLSGLQQPMDFVGRLKNFLFATVTAGIFKVMDYNMGLHYDVHFPSDKYSSYDEMKRNVSLIFVNTYLNQAFIQPKVPAIVEVGGIQIKSKPDPLPEDIKNYLDSAKDGVIYFCLGSNLRQELMSQNFIDNVFKTLSKLKQKVIWKWDDAELPGKSSNILYKKWLPQDDILAHPNVKLFITHAGAGGFAEAQYHGVPMLAIPFFADQFTNANKVQNSGYGLTLNPNTLTEESLRNAVLEIVNNPKYRKTVTAFSKIFKDRPMTAKDTAAYWMEYVLRHRGAKHLQSPAIHMNFIQYYGLDVIGFLLVVIYVAWKTLRFIWSITIGALYRKLFKKTKIVSSKKKNQ